MSNYTDGIRVKISERYKPPHKINLAMTYAQRLSLNKQSENIPNYEFNLEKTVISKMNEWRNVRRNVREDRMLRLEKANEELKDQQEDTQENEATATTCNNQTITAASTNTSNILIPTQMAPATYSNILTPIPLNHCTKYPVKPDDKSPFNISDFENDTSSPFDNMELKSINDMEELAQVLKRDDATHNHSIGNYSSYNYPPIQQHNYNQAYNLSGQYNYNNIPNSLPYVANGGAYYVPQNSFSPPHTYDLYAKQSGYTSSYQPPIASQGTNKNSKSVPDIIKALQVELENSHLDNIANIPESRSLKNADAVFPKAKTKVDDLENPFRELAVELQEDCRSISSMGFPLSRVARACKAIGGDYKKIVEHLLALTQLLDLGFAEQDISNALLQCDNDKDKALDKLIS